MSFLVFGMIVIEKTTIPLRSTIGTSSTIRMFMSSNTINNNLRHSSTSSSSFLSSSSNNNNIKNYVFGYGSLICPKSRSITNPNLAQRNTMPVLIRDLERVWSARSYVSGYTTMGVQFNQGSECTGIVIEVNDDELQDLDVREKNYNRLSIHLDTIEPVPFLLQEEYYYNDEHPIFTAQKQRNVDNSNVKVWVYMQKNPIFADASHPIAQSYVDIIIRGCLSISEEFARSFIETTIGWQPTISSYNNNIINNEEVSSSSDTSTSSSSSDNGITTSSINTNTLLTKYGWVNDRNEPLYVRADIEYSKQYSNIIDELFEQHKPIALEKRVIYNPYDHLSLLKMDPNNDTKHRRAIRKILSVLTKRQQKARTNFIINHQKQSKPNRKQ